MGVDDQGRHAHWRVRLEAYYPLMIVKPLVNNPHGSYGSCRTRGVARDLGVICTLAASFVTGYNLQSNMHYVRNPYMAWSCLAVIVLIGNGGPQVARPRADGTKPTVWELRRPRVRTRSPYT